MRCIGLARVLRDKHRCEVTFATRGGSIGVKLIGDAGFPVIAGASGDDLDYPGWLEEAVESTHAQVLVLDVRDKLTLEDVRRVRAGGRVRVAVIDDGSERRLAADHAFFPPVPHVERLEWPGFGGTMHVGWEWALLRPEFAEEPPREPHACPTVLVSMGGTDPMGLTPMVVGALALLSGPLRCVVLLGPGRTGPENPGIGATGIDAVSNGPLAAALDGSPHDCRVVRSGDVRALMLESDLAVLAFGMTAYEAAACALPAVHLPLNEDHALSSAAFADAGMAVSLGLAEQVDETELAAAAEALLADAAALRAMGARARSLVDGRGALRIAAAITEAMAE